jgi:hypothetical protein
VHIFIRKDREAIDLMRRGEPLQVKMADFRNPVPIVSNKVGQGARLDL